MRLKVTAGHLPGRLEGRRPTAFNSIMPISWYMAGMKKLYVKLEKLEDSLAEVYHDIAEINVIMWGLRGDIAKIRKRAKQLEKISRAMLEVADGADAFRNAKTKNGLRSFQRSLYD